jgi:excisionase family DNA binding protein
LKIKEIREKCGITIPELSDSSGLSENILKSIESGRRDIKVSELFQISKALNVRIASFLNPCDSQFYQRRKEEVLDCYVSLDNLSQILSISTSSLREFCRNDEIPYLKISGKYFFKASEINEWLSYHCGIKKRIKADQKKRFKIFGIEPLISAKEAAEIFGYSRTFIYRLSGQVPYFRIGGSIRFKLSDLENYRDKKRVDLWEITTRIGRWKSSFVWPEPSIEEKMAEGASYKREYDENARPGYVVNEKNFKSPDFIDLKQEVEEYIEKHIPAKSNVLGCEYYVIERLKLYGCVLKWWALPEGRESFKVHSTGLSSDSPNKIRDKVDDFIKRKVNPEDLIGVDYYTWGASFTDECHCARIIYYIPKKK